MFTTLKNINHKLNSIIWTLTSSGVVLLMLAVLIVWTDFMLRLVIGLLVIVIAYSFLYAAYKMWVLKKEIDNRLDLFKDFGSGNKKKSK